MTSFFYLHLYIHMCMRIVDMSRSFAALCGRFHGYVRKKIDRSPNLLASLNCSERAEIEDDFAVSLATSG